ncbi:MAG: SLC13 family permease [Xanthomonadales bacterium]|nr:anion permease [Gammaproteobacteria bacterium]MBT8053588.1 anion permease [Gammaproteobacteria bacterium]NND57931.1 SLC13 family permease [Xanthomonadales bacterium]NNK50903.1 SLC13 family permease [Xanthomonadales bacterium]
MTSEQVQILLILAATIGLFLWGRWRHDIVALGCLLAAVFTGIVPSNQAFSGFGHPAVITVGCVLILSWGLQSTGAVDLLARRLLPASSGPTMTIAAITGLGAVLSAFMNNVGALALLMPLALQLSNRLELPPGKVLMPLSFGTILGGMTTLIGTPPNLIVSGFRAKNGLDSFGMFDFTPVGLAVAVVGVLFAALAGWRIVPAREQKGADSFDTGAYLVEARIMDKAKAAGKTIKEVEAVLEKSDAQVTGMIRNEFRVSAPNPRRILRPGDILIIEADPESLSGALSSLGLVLEDHASLEAEEEPDSGEEPKERESGASETVLQELVVMPNSRLIGRSVNDVHMRTRYGLNLLAISRTGKRTVKRLRSTVIKAGDLLLLQGNPGALAGFATSFACVPLAKRDISLPDTRKTLMALTVMAFAIGGAAFGLLPAAISFATGVLALMVLKIVPLRKLYDAVDWPVIVLLGALIPVAVAMETTGAADLLARSLLETIARGSPVIALTLILVVTMTLSDLMNNAATAAVMAPISISTAAQLNSSPDTFLMAVAIGASCAFLTPIGHQNNTLILGPGGFRFGDYWRLGLPMEILVVAISVPMLLIVWPL